MLERLRTQTGTTAQLRVLHHASFGVNNTGIVLDLEFPTESLGGANFGITSLSSRGKAYLLYTSPPHPSIRSLALEISKHETEFQLRAHKFESGRKKAQTLNNSLVDTFADVWSRYPVVPALQR